MKNKPKTILEKINEGVLKAYDKLVHEKALVDGDLIFAEDNGKIIRVKAKELLKK